jgi:hypothetical protein
MNERRLSDAQIAAALQGHLPSTAQAGLKGRVIEAVAITSQQRPLPSFLGALSDADAIGRQRSLLVAALVLIALAIAAIIVVGSALLRPAPEDLLLGADEVDCSSSVESLPPGQVASLTITQGSYRNPDERDRQIVLFDDGRLVTRRLAWTAPLDTREPAVTARRLSPVGIAAIRDAILDSRLVAPGCLLELDTSSRDELPQAVWLSIRPVGAADATTVFSRDGPGNGLRQMTPAEAGSALLLIERLERPDSWLPAEAFIDPENRPYLPDDWILVASGWSEGEAPPTAPEAAAVTLPGGRTLIDFGTPFAVDDPQAERCEVIEADRARRAAEVITLASDPRRPWWFAHDGRWIQVRLVPLLDAGYVCAVADGGPEPPSPSPSAPPPELPIESPCDLVSADLVRALYSSWLHIGLSNPPAETQGFGGDDDYVGCTYEGGEGEIFSIRIAVRTRSTVASRADDIAHTWLGPDAVTGTADGHPAWQNRCMADPWWSNLGCIKAVAVFAEPWFIVITMVRGSHPIPTEIVPALIPVLVERLEQTGPARTP